MHGFVCLGAPVRGMRTSVHVCAVWSYYVSCADSCQYVSLSVRCRGGERGLLAAQVVFLSNSPINHTIVFYNLKVGGASLLASLTL